ncbi:MAG: hypothetical protein NVS9B5_03590 [Terriglobales bacterium]
MAGEQGDSSFFKTFHDMEQFGFSPVLKDIASLVYPTIQEAHDAAPELTARTFQVVSAFVALSESRFENHDT